MAEAITVACPECDKKVNVPADAVGKKIRCKGCQHVFPIPAPAGTKAAPAKAPAGAKPADAKKKAPVPKPAPAKPAPAKPPDDDEEDNNPYGITALDTAARCPECANEMESEDAIICLHCGYNTMTRTRIEARAVEDVTRMTWFLWLLPGIACALGFLFLFIFDLWWTLEINRMIDADAWYAFIGSAPFIIWAIWAPSILLNIGLVTFAVKRLIQNPRPPERVKKQKPKAK